VLRVHGLSISRFPALAFVRLYQHHERPPETLGTLDIQRFSAAPAYCHDGQGDLNSPDLIIAFSHGQVLVKWRRAGGLWNPPLSRPYGGAPSQVPDDQIPF